MTIPHYFAILGLPLWAKQEAIVKALKREKRRYHPDRFLPLGEDSSARFMAIVEAGKVLSSPEAKHAYFESLLGLLPKEKRSPWKEQLEKATLPPLPQASHRRLKLELEFFQAIRGHQVELALNCLLPCETCHASGFLLHSLPSVCPDCAGLGECFEEGLLKAKSKPCIRCQRRGFLLSSPCEDCHGRGQAPKEESLSLRIPEGSEDRASFRYASKGEPGTAMEIPGDLLITLSVTPKPQWERQGMDLFCRHPLPFWEALSGETQSILGPHGNIAFEIRPCTMHEDVVRIPARGVHQNGRSGDLFVTLVYNFPRYLDDAHVKALKAWGQSLPKDAFKV